MKLTIHLSAKFVLRKHAANSMFNNPSWFFTKSVPGFLVSISADVTGVVEVYLLQFFLACQNDFICVDDDNVVACINMRCVSRFIFACEDFSYTSCQTAKCQSFCINNIPFTGDVSRIGHKCAFHYK